MCPKAPLASLSSGRPKVAHRSFADFKAVGIRVPPRVIEINVVLRVHLRLKMPINSEFFKFFKFFKNNYKSWLIDLEVVLARLENLAPLSESINSLPGPKDNLKVL